MRRKRTGKGRARKRATVIGSAVASAVAGSLYVLRRRRSHEPEGQPDEQPNEPGDRTEDSR